MPAGLKMITDIPVVTSKIQVVVADKNMVVAYMRVENTGPVLKALLERGDLVAGACDFAKEWC